MKKINPEDFKKILERKGYSYKEENGRIVIDRNDHTNEIVLALETIPEGVIFKCNGHVIFKKLRVLPRKTEFYNKGWVESESIVSVRNDCVFKNAGKVEFEWCERIGDNVLFKNTINHSGNKCSDVNVSSCEKFGKNVRFENEGDVSICYYPESLFNSGVRFENGGNLGSFSPHPLFKKKFFIEGIDWKKILNCYIKQIYG
jgi:hypothetical protein